MGRMAEPGLGLARAAGTAAAGRARAGSFNPEEHRSRLRPFRPSLREERLRSCWSGIVTKV
jgi:hypothetical protein